MPTAVGPNTKGEENLVFGYDLGDGKNSFKGAPTVNTWNNNTYSYTWANASIERNSTPPIPPPKEARGFEVIKLTSTDGLNAQTIPWTSLVDQVNGGTYTHSVYVYLESGTNVQVGQHWNPWAYGAAQSPPRGKWVRLSQVVTNSTNNYGNIANAYITNGTAYFTATQYELGTVMTPFTLGTRSATQGLIDITGNSTIDLTNVSFDSNAQMTFDGTDDRVEVPDSSIFETNEFTAEAVCKLDTFDNAHRTVIAHNASVYTHTNGWWVGTLRNGLGSGNNDFRIFVWGDSSYVVHNNAIGGSDGQHHHLALTCNEGTVVFYIDGTQVYSATKPSGNAYTSGQDVLVGKSPDGDYWSGEIPLSKFYNRALTASEIKANYNAIKGRFNI